MLAIDMKYNIIMSMISLMLGVAQNDLYSVLDHVEHICLKCMSYNKEVSQITMSYQYHIAQTTDITTSRVAHV